MKTFAQSGYPVVGLNARTYFWQRKTPEQTAADVQALIDHYGKEWNRTKVILIGYSFGADVMPFVYNRLTTATQSNVVHQVLLSPSATTDFEVHVSEMLGYRRNNGKSVLDEINKSIHCNFLFLFGEADDNFPMNKLTIKRYKNLTLPGGHHFDNNIKEVVSTIQNEW
jgi:type IV secretory pathway VirJ component